MMSLYVITITKDDYDGISDTVQSVSNHLGSIAGHIIVNGGTCKNSAQLISSYSAISKKITVLSGPDNGIYDAMQKGASIIDDDSYVWYVNSGDRILFIPDLSAGHSCFYFGVVIKERGSRASAQVWGTLTLNNFFPASVYWHQGFIIRAGALKKIGFGNFKYRGDLYLMSMAHRYLDFKLIHQYPCLYSISGVSNSYQLILLREYISVARTFNFSIFALIFFRYLFFIKFFLNMILKKYEKVCGK